CSVGIGSSLGGSNWTGTLGSNLGAIAEAASRWNGLSWKYIDDDGFKAERAPPAFPPDYFQPAADSFYLGNLILSRRSTTFFFPTFRLFAHTHTHSPAFRTPLPPQTSTSGLASSSTMLPPSSAGRRLMASLRPLHLRRPFPPSSPSYALAAGSTLAKRNSSSIPPPRPPSIPPPPPPVPPLPKMTRMQFLRKLLKVSLQNLALSMTPRGIRAAFRDSPIGMTYTTIVFVFTMVVCAFAIYEYRRVFYKPAFSIYPREVGDLLRRALYYTIIYPNPELALRFYNKAMEKCSELGFDATSDQMLYIRVQVASWLEHNINNYQKAAEVLKLIKADCVKFVFYINRSIREGKVDDKGMYRPDAAAGGEASSPVALLGSETLWRKRQRLLSLAVGISAKLGELYADEHVLEFDNSQASLIWAVETSLAELQRRHKEGSRPGEEEWLEPQKLGAMMESLGRSYERKGQYQLCIPLFIYALRLCTDPCQRAMMMNNLAVAFAQQSQTPTSEEEEATTVDGAAMPTTREGNLTAAHNWATNAQTHGGEVRGEDRTVTCDRACAAALCTFGDLAVMMGKPELARARFCECREMSLKFEFDEGVKQAEEGLARLKST
ncbi:hypothetical protein L249_5080, partial [Ophiocordyceps polyrhachis-furcata BCC 54312]